MCLIQFYIIRAQYNSWEVIECTVFRAWQSLPSPSEQASGVLPGQNRTWTWGRLSLVLNLEHTNLSNCQACWNVFSPIFLKCMRISKGKLQSLPLWVFSYHWIKKHILNRSLWYILSSPALSIFHFIIVSPKVYLTTFLCRFFYWNIESIIPGHLLLKNNLPSTIKEEIRSRSDSYIKRKYIINNIPNCWSDQRV